MHPLDPVITELADFATQSRDGPHLRPALSRFARHHVKGLTMRLLSWLRDEHRPSVSLDRRNRNVPSDMQEFIETVPGLGQLVTVTDGVLNFNRSLSPSEKTDLARQAYETYKPTVSITWIVPRSLDNASERTE